VAEGVADALPRVGILVVAGVAHQRPAGAVRRAEEVGQVRRADEALFTPARLYPRSELGRAVRQDAAEGAVDVGAVRMEAVAGQAGGDAGEAVVGGKADAGPAGARVNLSARHRYAAPVAVVVAGQGRLLVVSGGPHRAGDQGMQPVGADDDLRLLR